MTHMASPRKQPAAPGEAPNPPRAAAAQAGANSRPADARRSVHGMIETAVRRVIDVVDEETEALRGGTGADLRAFNERKSLGLIELNRALRLLDGAEPDRATRSLLETLNERLTLNRHVLTIQLEAVREVAGVISQSIREAESDGTYTLAFRSKGGTP
jgi:hypothetical protein